MQDDNDSWINQLQSLLRYRDSFQIILITLIFCSIVIFVDFIISDRYDFFYSRSQSNFYVLIFALMTIIMTTFALILTVQKNPSSIFISLIGFTKSGKTVFLTMLFNEFIPKKIDGVQFSTYGSETAEEVANNLNQLYSKHWLQPTGISSIFPFRAKASLESGLNTKRFKIEIVDFAGEYSEEFIEENWLHKSRYFNYVLKSDIVFIAIDGEIIFNSIKNGDFTQSHLIENSYLTALRLIIEGKGVPTNKKMRTPVALIITKCDLFYPYFEEMNSLAHLGSSVSNWDDRHKKIVLHPIQRLVDFCDNNLLISNIFFVTSVGKLDDPHSPPTNLKPENITQPIIWALRNAN